MIRRIENELGPKGEAYVRAVEEAVAILSDAVVFDRLSIDEEMVGDSFLVRITIPSSRPGYRRKFLVHSPSEARERLINYLKRKYGASSTRKV